MPELVTAAQLRAVLGVPNTLYDDTALDAVIDTVEDAIGDFFIQWKVNLTRQKYDLATTTATVETSRPHKFYVGQTIAISGVAAHFNGNQTITNIPDDYTFQFIETHITDHDFYNVIPNGVAAANDLSQYNGNAAIEEAVLQECVDVFQSRLAAGGTQQALDFTPAPYRMGRTFFYKVTGLVSKHIDSNSQVG
jgi:hypothetical protein